MRSFGAYLKVFFALLVTVNAFMVILNRHSMPKPRTSVIIICNVSQEAISTFDQLFPSLKDIPCSKINHII